MSTWRDRLTDHTSRRVFYLVIEGIPYVFCNHPASWGWSAPECARHTSSIPDYTVLYDCLQISGGLEPTGWAVKDKAGIIEPGNMSLKLTGHRNVLLELFATRLKSGNRTRATSPLGWDTSGTGEDRYKIEVEDTTGWASAGPLYTRRETCYYTSKGSTRFGDDPESASTFFRGCWVWRWDGSDDWDSWHAAYRHYWDEGDSWVAENVADYPTRWRGRRAVLCMNFLRPEGDEPYDDDWRGYHEVEIYGGIIQSDPVASGKNYDEYVLHLSPLTSLLDTTIGTTAADGTIGVPGDSTVPWVSIPEQQAPVVANAQLYNISGGIYEPKENVPVSCYDYLGNQVTDAYVPWYTFIKMVAWGLYYDIYEPTGNWSNWPQVEYATGSVEVIPGGGTRLQFEMRWGDPTTGWEAQIDFEFFHIHMGVSASGGSSNWASNKITWDEDSSPGDRISRFNNKPYAGDLTSFAVDTRFPVALSDISKQYGREFTSGSPGGYAVLSTGEVIEYGGTDTNNMPAGYVMMNVNVRGALGTEQKAIPAVSWSGDDGDKITIREALGVTNDPAQTPHGWPIWKIFLGVAISTGGGEREATYDHDSFKGWCAAICPSVFSQASWEALAASEGSWAGRLLALSKATKLSDWIKKEAVFAQAVICQRTCYDGRVRIGIYPLTQAVQSGRDYALTSLRGEPVADRGQSKNSVSIKTGWHPGKGKFEGTEQTFPHVESVYADQGDFPITVEAPGLYWSFELGASVAWHVAGRILARRLEPGQLVKIYAGADALLLVPGQTIGLTVPDIPTDEGVRGLDARAVTVLGVRWCGYAKNRDWQAELTCRIEPTQRISTYCPVGKVSSYSAGTPSITLVGNFACEKTDNNPWGEHPCTDAVWFQDDYGIYVWNEGDWGSGDSRQVVSRSGNVLTINSALSITPGSECYVSYISYDSGLYDSGQKRWVHIADDGSPPSLGSASDDAFVYAE